MGEAADKVYDIIIIGAGPAGLSAAIYSRRFRLNVLIIESPSVISRITYAQRVENYPGFPEGISGTELLKKFKDQANSLGAEFSIGKVSAIKEKSQIGKKIWQVDTDSASYNTLSVIIASGYKPKELGLESEKRLLGKGVSYCAICDGPLFKSKDIAVVGANKIALEEAAFLTRFAKKVIVITEEAGLSVKDPLKKEILSNKSIEILYNARLKEIRGADKVEAAVIEDVNTAKVKEVSSCGVFIFAGFVPSTDFAKSVVKVDDKGYIIVDATMQASREGIFACGDCRNPPLHQVVTACADGAIAAYYCRRYLGG